MEILFYRYNNICEPDIIQTFTGFGITVHTEEMEIFDKTVTPKQCAGKITQWLLEHSFAFVFSINFFPAISYTCNHFKIPYVCWSVDSPVPELFSNALKNEWNRIFLFDRAQYQLFHPVNPERIFYLPLAVNVRRWEDIILNMTREDYIKYESDVSFVGSLYTEKCRYDNLLRVQPPFMGPDTDRPLLHDTHVSPVSSTLPDDNTDSTHLSAHEKHTAPTPLPASSISQHTRGFVDGLMEAQLKVYGYNFIADSLTDQVIREIADADPDFYRGSDTYTDTDRYLTAHQYIGMKLAALERERTLNRLAEHFQVTLYTRSDTSPLRNVRCMGPAKTLTEMPRIFHASRINLNITMRPIETGLSLRIWDVLGCGGFLITNYQAEIPDYFEIGRELETYESMEELEQKVQYYLTHEDERIEIAINGYEKVARMHTYEIRLAEMIRILNATFI